MIMNYHYIYVCVYRGNNVCVLCEEHQLLAVGTEQGQVECFDPRSNTKVGLLDIKKMNEVDDER